MSDFRPATVAMATVLLLLISVLLAGCGDSQAAPELTEEEEQALLEEAISEANGDLEVFAATGVNPCGLKVVDGPGHYTFRYEDIQSLINDVDLIVEGRFGASSMDTSRSGTIAARMPVQFEVDDVLLGDSPGREMILQAGGRVTMSRDRPVRSHSPQSDQCAIDQAILFFDGPADEGVYGVVAILAFVDGKSEADPFHELVDEGVAVQEVRADILSMIEEQQAEDVPEGRLLCESRRESDRYRDPRACPGDSFNPYEAYGLARPLEVRILHRDAGGQVLEGFEVPTDAPNALELLALLDLTVLLESGEQPDGEIIDLSIATATTGTPPFNVTLQYDVESDTIWLSLSGGRIPAPDGFREALEALLEAPPRDATDVSTETPPIWTAPTTERGIPIHTPGPPRTSTGPAMRLTLVAGGYCTGDDCFVDAGSTFTLAVEVVEAPPSYVFLQTYIGYGTYDPSASEDGAGPDSCGDGIQNGYFDGTDRSDEDCVTLDLTYLPTANAQDELFWTDPIEAAAVREINAALGFVWHAGVTGFSPQFVSTQTGVIVQLQMSCPAGIANVLISLLRYNDPLAGTTGSLFLGPDGRTQIVPAVSSINLHCVAS